MKILAIDTSTNHFSLAVVDEEKARASRDVELKKVLSDSIIQAIDRILKKGGTELRELDALAVGLGPGSFTSLRVGLATIKAFSFSVGKPVVGIASLDALAFNVRSDHAVVAAVTDARRGLVYAGLYQKKNGGLQRVGDYQLQSPKDLLKRIKQGAVLVGDGIPAIKQIASKEGRIIYAPEKLWRPSAKVLAGLALKKLQAGKVDDIDRLVPLYLYPAQCQVRNR